MTEHTDGETRRQGESDHGDGGPKRPRQPHTETRYPRKRSLKACHVCRARKTKCDNVRPTCGFCASVNIRCSYDVAGKDYSSFDPASLEILRQLGEIASSQDDLLQLVRSVATSQPPYVGSGFSPAVTVQTHVRDAGETTSWDINDVPRSHQAPYAPNNWFTQQSDAISTTSAASAGVAAARWFDLLANDASREESQEADVPVGIEGGFLEPPDGQKENEATPLQRATRIIDSQPPTRDFQVADSPTKSMSNMAEEHLWQAAENIALLDHEQVLFEHFLHRICSWLDLFDPACTFSTRVPHLAVRNAGLLNAILALSEYHQAFDRATSQSNVPGQNAALQYYYQTLHYVQKAMRYSTYQNSQELMATTLVVSTYEMLRGSRNDWQQHLKGVFWILRSRQIEVETCSLESTTWWAWLRQDIWVAFREKRRTYSTWAPRKTYSELSNHEVASRSTWILAQVVNFCAPDAPQEKEVESHVAKTMRWALALENMLEEWRSHLTVEFSALPCVVRRGEEVFQPRLIHPQCFALAIQIHHVSQILLNAHRPSLGGLETFMKRQKTIQDSIEIVCGIGMTLTEDASSMLSSQCLFIAAMFIHDSAQKDYVLDMLEACRSRCGWPTPSLGTELRQIWASSANAPG